MQTTPHGIHTKEQAMLNRSLHSGPILRGLAVLVMLLAVMVGSVVAQEPASTGVGHAGNAGGSHSYPGPGPTGDVQVLWELDIPDGYFQGLPVAFGDYLLVTASSEEFGGNLTVYNLMDGTFLWNHAESTTFSDPFIDDGHVYLMQDNRRFALDLESGEPVWDITLDDAEPPASAAFTDITGAGGVIYTNQNATLFALDGETGDELWRRTFPGYAMDVPIIAGDVVVASSFPVVGDGESGITRTHGISRETGNEVWRKDARNTSVGYEASADGQAVLVFELSARDFMFTDATVVDARDGQPLWSPFANCGADNLAPAIYADALQCVGTGFLLDITTGEPVSDVLALAEDHVVIAVAGNTLYVTDNAGNLHGIDMNTGDALWMVELAGEQAEGDVVPFLTVSVGNHAAVVDIIVFAGDGELEPRAVILGDPGTAPAATPAATPVS